MQFNVWNHEDIDKALTAAANGDEKLARLMILALKKPLLNRTKNLRPLEDLTWDMPKWLQEKFSANKFYTFDPQSDFELLDTVRHVHDWIKGAIMRGEAWTQEEKPRCLSQFKTIEEAYEAVDAAMEELRRAFEKARFDPIAGTYIDMEFQDGWKIRRLITPEAKDYDGQKLHHCVGDGTYDNNGSDIYSLRDANENPFATIEIHNGFLIQCKGVLNSPPDERALPYLEEFIRSNEWRLAEAAGQTGMVQKDGIYYSIFDMPEYVEIGSALNLTRIHKPLQLPEGLRTIAIYVRANSIPENATFEDLKEQTNIIFPEYLRVADGVIFSRKYKSKLHNEEGPAMVKFDPETGEILQKAYYRHGKMHNEHGPARFIYDSDHIETEWAIEGKIIERPGEHPLLKHIWSKWAAAEMPLSPFGTDAPHASP